MAMGILLCNFVLAMVTLLVAINGNIKLYCYYGNHANWYNFVQSDAHIVKKHHNVNVNISCV